MALEIDVVDPNLTLWSHYENIFNCSRSQVEEQIRMLLNQAQTVCRVISTDNQGLDHIKSWGLADYSLCNLPSYQIDIRFHPDVASRDALLAKPWKEIRIQMRVMNSVFFGRPIKENELVVESDIDPLVRMIAPCPSWQVRLPLPLPFFWKSQCVNDIEITSTKGGIDMDAGSKWANNSIEKHTGISHLNLTLFLRLFGWFFAPFPLKVFRALASLRNMQLSDASSTSSASMLAGSASASPSIQDEVDKIMVGFAIDDLLKSKLLVETLEKLQRQFFTDLQTQTNSFCFITELCHINILKNAPSHLHDVAYVMPVLFAIIETGVNNLLEQLKPPLIQSSKQKKKFRNFSDCASELWQRLPTRLESIWGKVQGAWIQQVIEEVKDVYHNKSERYFWEKRNDTAHKVATDATTKDVAKLINVIFAMSWLAAVANNR
jgi:hypothetical protein